MTEWGKLSYFVSDSRLLSFFFKEDRSILKRATIFLFMLFGLPLVLLIVSAKDKFLFLPGNRVGMLEDYLILSTILVVSPSLYFLLRLVINRFIFFIRSIKSFSTLDEARYESIRSEALTTAVAWGKDKRVIFLKYLFGVIALASNMYSITKRADGWNSIHHPVQYTLTFIYLAFLICFYLNNILFKYLLILWTEISTAKKLAKADCIVVNPRAPDKAGGLRSMGELSIAFTYFLIPFTIVGLTHYFTWKTFTIGSTMGTVSFIPLFVIVFFVPLGVVHNVMAEAKRETLKDLSDRYLDISNAVIEKIKDKRSDADLVVHKELIEMLDSMYEKSSKMPVWPFDTKTLTKFFSVTFAPLGVIFLESFIQMIFGKLLG